VVGIRHYPRNEQIDAFCSLQVPPPGGKKAVNVEVVVEKKNKERTFADINIEIADCKACDLHKHRISSVAGNGGAEGRLLIVGDWLSGDVDNHLEKDQIFGVEQDQMLDRMFSAINLLPAEVFITNVIKCAVPVSCNPAAEHVHCCMSFLHRQIAILVPEVICTMGMIAAKALLDKSQSLSQLRGTFHTYDTEDGLHIPVLATYHPTYLLQNPEMKKATWADLQLLAKKLR